jgi:hypothetical protein
LEREKRSRFFHVTTLLFLARINAASGQELAIFIESANGCSFSRREKVRMRGIAVYCPDEAATLMTMR